MHLGGSFPKDQKPEIYFRNTDDNFIKATDKMDIKQLRNCLQKTFGSNLMTENSTDNAMSFLDDNAISFLDVLVKQKQETFNTELSTREGHQPRQLFKQ